MRQTWILRLILALSSLALAIYLLIPTFIYFSLDEEQLRQVRRDKDAFNTFLPSWLPKTHIVPGLDLQGGIHMVLGVDVAKALADRTSRISDRLRDYAQTQHLPFEKLNFVSEPNAAGKIEVLFATTEELNAFKSKSLEQFRELVISSESLKKLTLELDPNLVQSARRDSVDQTINTITTRIDKMGVTEPSISKRGDDQIQIQLPGYDNSKEARSLIGRTAQLEFQMLDDDTEFLSTLTLPEEIKLVRSGYGRPGGGSGKDLYLEFPESKLMEVKTLLAGKLPDELVVKYGKSQPSGLGPMMRTYTLSKRVSLTGDDLVDAHVSMGSMDSPRPAVALTFSAAGGRTFAALTKDNIGKRMAIVLEETVDSAPVIQTEIPNGTASITMGGARTREEMIKEANQLSLVLKAGALPAPVTFREERSVGPSLGADSVKAGSIAFMVGAALVAIFMLFYYRVAGLISLIGVTFNVAFILAFMSLLGATMTLPGVAALLLTVGMAVDTNVIINERIREELRLGKMPRSAVKAGYHAAFSAIIDSHATTFISGVVLWQFGTGPVQNFATTVMIGTVASIVTGIFITRIFFDILTRNSPQTLSV